MANHNKPTQRELRWAQMFMSVAKLMEEDLEFRNPERSDNAANLSACYAPLRTLLDGAFICNFDGLDQRSVNDAREQRREHYARLVNSFEQAVRLARKQLYENKDDQRDWTDSPSLRDNWTLGKVFFQLRMALILHALRVRYCSLLVKQGMRSTH